MTGKSDDFVGDDLAGAGVVHGRAERGHEGQHEDGQELEGLERLFFGEDAGGNDEDGAAARDDVDGRQEVDIVGQDHEDDGHDEVDSSKDAVPLRNVAVVGVRLTHLARGAVLDELVAEEEHEDRDGEQHRDADLGILEEADMHRAVGIGLDGVLGDEVTGRADDREVRTQGGSRDERDEQFDRLDVGRSGDPHDDGKQDGDGAGVGHESGHDARQQDDDQDEASLAVGQFHDLLRYLVRQAGLEERRTNDAHGNDENDVGIDNVGKDVSDFDDAEEIEHDRYAERNEAHRQDIDDEEDDRDYQYDQGDGSL